MHQERDADCLAHVRGQIHRLVNPGLPVATLMENRLKDVAVAVGDVSVLLVRRPKRCHKVSATSLFLGRRSSLQGFNESNLPRFFIQHSDGAIVGSFCILVRVPYSG